MNQSASLGMNKTGSATAPQRLKEMLSGLEPFLPRSAGNAQAIANVRIAYATEAETVGSVPIPVSLTGGPSREDLQQILDDEFNHFTMLTQTMEQLGGDPTAVTPSANLHATLSM